MKPPDLRNPYEHMHDAREAEAEGNVRRAESQWKTAVIAADSLPLIEYKRNFREELVRYSFDPTYQSQPGVTEPQLREVYSDLLALPFTTRMHLATFYGRHGAYPEAREACEQAFAYGMDSVSREHAALKDFYQRSEIVRENLHNAVGPDNLPQVFHQNFNKLDLDGNGFIHQDELREAQYDLSLSAECHLVVRYLLEHYREVEAAHRDEIMIDIKGISRADVAEHEAKKNSNWKRMRKQ